MGIFSLLRISTETRSLFGASKRKVNCLLSNQVDWTVIVGPAPVRDNNAPARRLAGIAATVRMRRKGF